MKINYELVKGKDLKPGDLFVNATPEQMDTMMASEEGGVGVFIKTNQPLMQIQGAEADVQRITIVKAKKKAGRPRKAKKVTIEVTEEVKSSETL